MRGCAFLLVPPSKPVIRLAAGGSVLGHESVEGYLGPYQIGTRLSLVCQVNGGKKLFLLCIPDNSGDAPPKDIAKIAANLTLVVLMIYTVSWQRRFIPHHKL